MATYKTKNKANELTDGYRKSDAIQYSKNLSTITDAIKPSAYEDNYTRTAESVLNDYLSRNDYDFSINTDKLYRQYADQYKKNAQAAMKDTMAQASALTGGYGSSYGVTAGEQAYQNYMDQLNDKLSDIEKETYDRYTAEGDRVKNKLSMLSELDSAAYEKYRDRISDYQTDREYYNDNYRYESEADRELYELLTDYIIALAKVENTEERNNLMYANKT